jgi:hypothetical protein
MKTFQSYPATNGILARAELSALAYAIESGNGELPPIISRLIESAPDSFGDLRLGKIANVVRSMREQHQAVHYESVGLKSDDAIFVLGTLTSAALPMELAELEAQTVLEAFEVRRTKSIFADGMAAIESSPGQAQSIIEVAIHTLTELRESNNGETLAVRLAQRAYDPEAELEKPLPRFSIKDISVSTCGNLMTISAQAKAGKTAAIGAMIASTFAHDEADCLGFRSSNPHGRALIHIDSEQSLFDAAALVRLISKRAGKAIPGWVKSYCLTGWTANDIRKAIPVLMELAAKECGGIHSLLLDGVADAMNDVNDTKESNSFVAELHGLAIKFECAIITVIHLNPTSEFKTRGHLGSQLERKSETNLKCDKDENEIIVLWADKNRSAPIPKKFAPRFAWSQEAQMHTSVESAAEAKDDIEFETLSNLFDAAFADRPAMSYTDLTDAVISAIKTTDKRKMSVDPRTAQRKIARADKLGIIKKTFAGLYESRT